MACMHSRDSHVCINNLWYIVALATELNALATELNGGSNNGNLFRSHYKSTQVNYLHTVNKR